MEIGSDTLTIRGAKLAYIERGEGPAVVLVHGGPNDARTWCHQLDVIASRYRTIAYSRRYAWPNEPITGGLDDKMMPHVDDLAAVIRALDAAPAHLVGSSWGGFICLLLAIRERDLVRTLTLEEPPVVTLFVSMPPKPSELLRMFASRPRTAIAVMKFFLTCLAPSKAAAKRGDLEQSIRIFGQFLLGKQRYAAMPEWFREMVFANRATHAAQLLGKGFPPLDPNEVRRIDVPTLLLTGSESPAFLHRLTDRLAELLPHVERATIANASHAAHADNPEELNRVLLRFLDANTSRG